MTGRQVPERPDEMKIESQIEGTPGRKLHA
jgi:hypothetical protein